MNELTIQEVIDHCDKTAQEIERSVHVGRDWLRMDKRPLSSWRYLEHKQTAAWLRELMVYQRLIEQGRMMDVPYGLKQEVWIVDRDRVHPFIVISIEMNERGIYVKLQYDGDDPHKRYWAIRTCVNYPAVHLFTNIEDAYKAAEAYRRYKDNED